MSHFKSMLLGLLGGAVCFTAMSRGANLADRPLAIQDYGKIFPFPDAAEQPRDGSQIVVDLTADGPRDKLNPGIEKLARYVNIYSSAGARPAKVQITAVMHGAATPVALSDESYAAEFRVTENPNLALMKLLRKAGVQFVVCGQSLTHSGYKPGQVNGETTVAVSALTAVTNRQLDGCAYIPLR